MSPFLFPAPGEYGNNFLRVGIPTLKARKDHPTLLYIKERETRSKLRKKEHLRETESTLRVFLKNKEAATTRKKLLSKYDNLGSQLKVPYHSIRPFDARALCLHQLCATQRKEGALAAHPPKYSTGSTVVALSLKVGSPKGFLTGFPLFQSGTSVQPIA